MWRLSTGLRNALLEQKARVPHAVVASTISFGTGDGPGGGDTINDSAGGLAGFLVRDYITVFDPAGTSGNHGVYGQASYADANMIELPAGTLAAEAAGSQFVLASALGGSYRGIFRNMTIKIFTGPQPASADDAETGTELCQITLSSGAFTPGQPANGINFGQVAGGVLKKEEGEVWSGVNSADGVAGWFRIYANELETGASSDAVRLDGACATSGAQLNLTNTNLVSGVTTTIDQVQLTMPAE